MSRGENMELTTSRFVQLVKLTLVTELATQRLDIIRASGIWTFKAREISLLTVSVIAIFLSAGWAPANVAA